jgi:hypothetical protein
VRVSPAGSSVPLLANSGRVGQNVDATVAAAAAALPKR